MQENTQEYSANLFRRNDLSSQKKASTHNHSSRSERMRTRREGVLRKPVQNEQKDCFADIYKLNKQKSYVNLFLKKLRQVSVPHGDQQHLSSNTERFQIERNKFKRNIIPFAFDITLKVSIILQVSILSLFATTNLAFKKIRHDEIIWVLLVCMLVQLLEMASKAFFTSSLKIQPQVECKDVQDLISQYLRKQFLFDLVFLIVLIVDICGAFESVPFLRLSYLIKIKNALNQLEMLEIVLIQNCYNEEYWKLGKVFLFNFIFAHGVCLILIMIAELNPQHNWLKSNNFHHLPWIQRYIWAYYWAANIMLTVGFGDIHAVSTLEAGFLILIQMMSCIIFTYNINTVGNIIRKISSYDAEKDNNIKIFNRMLDKTDISSQLKNKVTVYINESAEMRRKYNIQEEQKLINELPTTILEEYRKETHRRIFQKIPFFRHLSNKYLLELAFKIERKLSHPEQILLSFKKVPEIVIANGGKISLHANALGFRIHNKKMQSIPLSKDDFKLLSFNFLFHKEMNYDIKCEDYCVIYKLSSQDLRNIIEGNPYNYQYYRMMKDKDKNDPSQFETLNCDICKSPSRHTVFNCPKIHYIPLKQLVIIRYNEKKEEKPKYKLPLNIRDIYQKSSCHPLLEYFLNHQSEQLRQSSFESQKDENIKNFVKKTRKNFIRKRLLPSSSSSSRKRGSRESSIQRLAKELKDEISKVEMRMYQQNFFQWEVECDQACDFKYYFTQDNPSELNVKRQRYYQKKKSKLNGLIDVEKFFPQNRI